MLVIALVLLVILNLQFYFFKQKLLTSNIQIARIDDKNQKSTASRIRGYLGKNKVFVISPSKIEIKKQLINSL